MKRIALAAVLLVTSAANAQQPDPQQQLGLANEIIVRANRCIDAMAAVRQLEGILFQRNQQIEELKKQIPEKKEK